MSTPADSRTLARTVWAVALTRAAVLVTGVLAVLLFGTTPPPAAEAFWRVSPNEVANLLARWDTFYYHQIATTGYEWNPSVFWHYNVVFFPLYPLLMRWGGLALGGHPLLAGLIVSLAAFAISMVLVYKLARLERCDAWTVILLMSTFPYALYYSVDYTESLFLMLSVAAFYCMRRGYLARAALAGLLAGLTRPNGFWLVPPLVWMALVGRAGVARDRSGAALAAAFMPVLGTVIFSVYLHGRFGDALAWAHGQAAWGLPLLGRQAAPDPVQLDLPPIQMTDVITWTGNVIAFAVAAASIVPVALELGGAYALWIALNIFPPVGAHLFLSLGRFVAVLFPVFFWLARRIPPVRVPVVAWSFMIAQIALAALFFLWRPVV